MALLLERRGWKVRVLERDRRPPVDSPEDAFREWRRPGLPQFRHSHTFLARLTVVLREWFPEVLTLLRSAGTIEIPLTVGTPPELDLGPRQKGDGELVLLGARRAAFEWALLEVARQKRDIEITEGVYCEELVFAKGRRGATPEVVGARVRSLPEVRPGSDDDQIHWRSSGAPRPTGRPRQLKADLVIDATGRRSRADEWIRASGAEGPEEIRIPTGIYYFTRFYRLIGARPRGASTGLVGGDVGWLKLATFPGDNDTFSITVGTSIEDRPLRALSDPRVFESLIAAFPQVGVWRADGVSAPLDGPDTPVLVMGGLENQKRKFDKNGALLVRGFVAIGDAIYHSNPIYGRGVTSGLISTTVLDQALAEHADDLDAAVAAYHDSAHREVEPFWQHAASGDRMSRSARRERSEEKTEEDLLRWASSWIADPTARMAELTGRAARTYLQQGFAPAMREDGQVFRAAMRAMNMLDLPEDSLFSPDVLARTVPFFVRSLVWPARERSFAGPSRSEAIELIERVRASGKTTPKKRAPRRPRRRVPRLRANSEVAGHA